MIVMGVDPGYAITGFGILEYKEQRFRALDYGIVQTDADTSFPDRLLTIHQAINHLIATYKPDCMAVEELFFSRNTTTAIGNAQARGVVVLSGAAAGLMVYEYTPMQVKVAVTGYGRAEKVQVQKWFECCSS